MIPEKSKNIILVTGGVKSGKTRFALSLADRLFDKKTYLATALPLDEEMKERIKEHRSSRDGTYTTIEEPLYIQKHTEPGLILDCLTLWMNNIFYYKKESEWENIFRSWLNGITRDAIIISNETGWGNIPPDPDTRRYNRALGMANSLAADRADRVYLMVSGIAVEIKS